MTKLYLEKRDCLSYPYPDDFYSPHVFYPEYPFPKETISSRQNEVYDMVRASLFGLGLDKENYGKGSWNPIGDYVKPKSRILIKPNFVNHSNPVGGLDCTVTHPSIIRCIIDYCVIAKAEIIEIGDAPIQNCDFQELMNVHGYSRMFGFFNEKGIKLKITDFRKTISKSLPFNLLLQQKSTDKEETIEFDLKSLSYFKNLPDTHEYQYGIANYYDKNINTNHNRENHKYLVTKSIIDADLIINLPKPKTHRFAGITGAQKNFIGICSDKEYLPHYRTGTAQNGGDETNHFSKLDKCLSLFNQKRCKYIEKQNLPLQLLYIFLITFVRKFRNLLNKNNFYSSGQWHGNDTIWRTVLDLNLILLYGNSKGILNINQVPARNILTVGDIIIAGEKSGPLTPEPKPLGIILASDNCAAFDYVFCKMTGFDFEKIPSVRYSINNSYLLKDSLETINFNSNINEYNTTVLPDIIFPTSWNFEPNPAWDEVLK